jgi:PhnB protein
MNFNAFINFDGNCREAVGFYATVFNQPAPKMMTFDEAPKSDGYVVNEGDKNRILYTELNIGDKNVMFSDCPSDGSFMCGNNICLVIGSKDIAEISGLFDKLKEQGHILMPLSETFWSKAFGMVKDKFGIVWQLSLEAV